MAMEVFAAALRGIAFLFLTCNIFGNVLVLVVLRRNKKKLCSANTFLLSNLAASDLTFAMSTFVNILSLSQRPVQTSHAGGFILHALASILTLVVLAVERYFAILKPFVHLSKGTKSLLCKVILAVWILSGVLSTPGYIIQYATANYMRKNITINASRVAPAWIETLGLIYPYGLFVFGLILPSSIMIFCYSRVIYHVWFNADRNRATNVALLKSRRKLTKLFIIITVIFIITWTPSFGMSIVKQFTLNVNTVWKFELFAMFLTLAGSTANPVIYSFRCPRFRQEVVRLLTCRCCKSRRPNISVFSTGNSYPVAHMERRTTTVAEPVLILKTN